MAKSPEEFAIFLRNSFDRIKREKSISITASKKDLGDVINRSPTVIEYWLAGNCPAELEQAVTAARFLLDKGGLSNQEEFEQFLNFAGHPNPTAEWKRLFPSVKVQGPEAVQYFTGREKEINAVLTALEVGRIVTVCGAGGIGKTALIAEVIPKLIPKSKTSPQFPDGIFYHDFYRESSTDVAIRKIVRFFEKEPIPTPYSAALEALSQNKALLVLDGAEEADNLRKVLDMRGRCGVLIVTRDRLTARGKTIEIEVLPIEQAVIVLQAWSTNADLNPKGFQVWSNDQNEDRVIAEEICQLIGSLPLALRLAGVYMLRTLTKALNYLQMFEGTSLDLTTLQIESRQHESVPVLIKQSLNKVSEHARAVMAVIGRLAYASFSADMIASALNTSSTSAEGYIKELVRFSMVNSVEDRYHVVHRLIHTYALNHLSVASDSLGRLIGYYTAALANNDIQFIQEDANKRDDVEHVRAILMQTTNLRMIWGELIEFTKIVDDYYNIQLNNAEKLPLSRDELFAFLKPKHLEQGDWFDTLGQVFHDLGHYSTALYYFDKAIDVYQDTGKFSYKTASLCGMGRTYLSLKKYTKAVSCYEDALTLAKEYYTPLMEAPILICLGTLYGNLENFTEAINCYRQARTIYQLLDQPELEIGCLPPLGGVYISQGKTEEGLSYYLQALTIAKTIDDKKYEGYSLRQLASAYHSMENDEIALKYYEQALTIFQKTGQNREIADILDNMGFIHELQGQMLFTQYALLLFPERELWHNKVALNYYNQAATIFGEIGDSNRANNAREAMERITNQINEVSRNLKGFQLLEQTSIDRRGIDRDVDSLWSSALMDIRKTSFFAKIWARRSYSFLRRILKYPGKDSSSNS